jgi:uncharacterized glyoxalase superfamily protein PhnB
MSDATVFPTLTYDDAQRAVEFLTTAFGFERHAVYADDGGNVQHAELRFGNGIVMLGSANAEVPAGRSGGIYVVVDDPDAHAAQARAAGADITRAPYDTFYDSREYSARDFEGNAWHFGTYQPFEYDHSAAQARASA